MHSNGPLKKGIKHNFYSNDMLKFKYFIVIKIQNLATRCKLSLLGYDCIQMV